MKFSKGFCLFFSNCSLTQYRLLSNLSEMFETSLHISSLSELLAGPSANTRIEESPAPPPELDEDTADFVCIDVTPLNTSGM